MLDYGAPFQLFSPARDPRLARKILVGAALLLSTAGMGFVWVLWTSTAPAGLSHAQRVLFAAVLGVGFNGFVLVGGYGLRVLSAVRSEPRPALPEWNQWRNDWQRGCQYYGLAFLWALPLTAAAFGCWLGSRFLWLLPYFGMPAAFPIYNALNALIRWPPIAATEQAWIAAAAGLGLAAMANFLAAPGMTIAFVQRGRFRDGLRVRAILAWTVAHKGPVARAACATFLAATVSCLAGLLAEVLFLSITGSFYFHPNILLAMLISLGVTGPLSMLWNVLYSGHLYGQVARCAHATVLIPPVPDDRAQGAV